MISTDFFFDGQYLSDFGMIICSFDGASGSETVSAGSKITFNTVPRHRGKKHSLTGTQYDECIQATFSIAKNPCVYDDMKITQDEYRDLMRWLNRNEYLQFQLIECDDGNDGEPCFYDASFNVEKRLINGMVYGLDLTLETNSPFGYGIERTITLDMKAGEKYTIVDASDEIGHTYPDLTITIGKISEPSDFTLLNETEDVDMVIKNCQPEEVINMYGSTFILTTDRDTHHLYDDFNFEFFRIGNTFDNRENIITATLPCTLEIKYKPVIKDSPN